MNFKQAIKIAKEKEGYIICKNPKHGFGQISTINGKTAKNTITICPIIQFYPKPSHSFHSKAAFVRSSEIYFKRQGWI